MEKQNLNFPFIPKNKAQSVKESIVGYTNAIGQYTINTKPGKNNTRFQVIITTQSTTFQNLA